MPTRRGSPSTCTRGGWVGNGVGWGGDKQGGRVEERVWCERGAAEGLWCVFFWLGHYV